MLQGERKKNWLRAHDTVTIRMEETVEEDE